MTKWSVPLLLLFTSLLGMAQKPAAPELPKEEVEPHVLAQTNPVYPALAKAAKIQGKVVLRITITAEGHVGNVRVVSGHPMLIPAAIDAVKKWEYRPFIINGAAAPVDTVIEIPFVIMPEADYQTMEQLSQDYFKKFHSCMDLMKKRDFQQAEDLCRSAVDAAKKLPESRCLERVTAHQWAGHSLFYQRKFEAALSSYLEELKSAESCLEPDNAEFAYALRDVAHAYHGTRDFKTGREYYERAEASLRAARDRIESEFHKNEYSRSLQGLLRDYANLLRQSGDSAAAAAEKRAAEIVVKEGVRNN